MITLGIAGFEGGHDASASLLIDGRIEASVEEERFNRVKHSTGLPWQAIDFCLKKTGISFKDINYVGFNFVPDTFEEHRYHRMIREFGAEEKHLKNIQKMIGNIRSTERLLKDRYQTADPIFEFVPHHDAHAVAAFYTSPFSAAAILTKDGSGDSESSALFNGEVRNVQRVHDFLTYPYSIGDIYSAITYLLGFAPIFDAGKVMGLAGFGRPIPGLFDDIVAFTDDDHRPIAINMNNFGYHSGRGWISEEGFKHFGPRRDPKKEPLTRYHCDLAASMQDILEKSMLRLLRATRNLLPKHDNLCLSGGVTLNISANRKIVESGLFKNVYFTPAANDAGTSLGCAVYLYDKYAAPEKAPPRRPLVQRLLKKLAGGGNEAGPKNNFSVYLGPDVEIDFPVEECLEQYRGDISWRRLGDDLTRHAAQLLAGGAIIGWAQGRMEWGPRALGNRSILANPLIQDIKRQLDAKVKKREPFRPYAASIIASEAGGWFDGPLNPHMLLEADVLPVVSAKIPSLTHVDGSCRPQALEPDDNPLYYDLLCEFFRITKCPMLLNTSFNLHGEPMVNSPDDVIKDLLNSGLDAVYLGRYYITRNNL